jgi:hypothetical protein
LGVDVDQELSPSLQEKLVFVGVLLKSFPQASGAIEKLLEVVFGRERLERLTERIGRERVEQRVQDVQAVQQLTLMDKIHGPAGVTPPVACAVMGDGGRLQKTVAQADSHKHWYEYKAGLCLTLGNLTDASDPTPPGGDPCPRVPEFLTNFEQVETLTREIAQRAASPSATAPEEAADEHDTAGIELESLHSRSTVRDVLSAATAATTASKRTSRDLPLSPRIKSREVVATLGNAREFGQLLVARAWQLGMFQSARQGFVADGGSWLWKLFETEFQPFGFVGILDLIHAVTHVFAAAMAGRERHLGWPIYRQWITWIWQGEVRQVITALAARQQELGEPTAADSATSPRRIVADTLTYLNNQSSHMNYPAYRMAGLPITSSHMESTMKELNYRLKGTEKFWSETGGEDLLQLRADSLSDSAPLTTFWKNRLTTRTGFHACANHRTKKQLA